MSIFSCEREIIAWEDYRITINNTHCIKTFWVQILTPRLSYKALVNKPVSVNLLLGLGKSCGLCHQLYAGRMKIKGFNNYKYTEIADT